MVVCNSDRWSGPKGRLAWEAAASLPDPELPFITIEELGILRRVDVEGKVAVAKVAPTYFGCPAMATIELAIVAELEKAGFQGIVKRVLEPAWTTDWISSEGMSKLHVHGIAPPSRSTGPMCGLFEIESIECPICETGFGRRVSEFGSTACKALYQCRSCGEPFEYFKKI